jgi:hypothetical protein
MNELEFISECLAAIGALFCYNKYKHKPIRTVLLLLWIAVIAEAAARLYIIAGNDNNHGIYNCYALLFYGLFYKMVYDHIQDPLRKKIVLILSVAMFLVIAFRAITTPFFSRFMTYVFNLATGVMVLQLMYYAIDLLKSNVRFQFKHNLEMIVFGAYLLFAISFIPLSPLVFGILLSDFLSETSQKLFFTIHGGLLISMNLILISGFLWTKAKKQH